MEPHRGRENPCVSSIGLDQAIAEVASRQNGRISRQQLIAIGLTDQGIAYRVRSRRLNRIRRGVFAVGHRAEITDGRLRAALLTVGDDSLVSHFSAAGKYEIRAMPIVIDITAPRRLLKRDGIRLHHRVIHREEIRILDGLPFTSPSQTIFDVGTMLGSTAHLKAANEAFVKRLCTIADLRATQHRNAGRKGSRAFRVLLDQIDPEGREVRSGLEVRLNAFLRTRGFPPWESNATLRIGTETIRPDVLWRSQRVIVEADGRDPHLAPLTFASDRRRDRRVRVEGWEPVRVTSVDLDRRPDELDADLRSLLGLGRSR